ncbi:MAG TPA: tRNA pseudouridine(38-40) synthase TruA [Hellea balneolensis]|uniref:tRNA pseudouridine synthase A n=1 Tax=Hellea balneolensis TaxID=287478 RepID=A0A7V5NWW5_9PROT|nr:tRNA pseudouridine(38-40) synthase TruA [Hellea balneolensis]
MTRYKLTIEYDGAPFMGWQRQKHGPSVQEAIEVACKGLDGTQPTVFGAGRTDAGVHALGQTAHVDLAKGLRADKVRDGLNHHLGQNPVSILEAETVSPDFNARFDARARTYLYRIVDRRPRLALERGRVWRIPVKMDAALMHHAAGELLGQHDFTTFRDTQCQAKSPIKTLDELAVHRVGAEIHIHAKARSFLHKQVRSIVGTLAEVGMGKWTARDVRAALKARDRTACGPVAPPDGLYLVKVDY